MTFLMIVLAIGSFQYYAPIVANENSPQAHAPCCPLGKPGFPYARIWIWTTELEHVSGSETPTIDSKPAATFMQYDLDSSINKVTVYEVQNQEDAVLTSKKLFDANPTALICPPGYNSTNPYNLDAINEPYARLLCLDQANGKMNVGQRYVVCLERSCTACYVDIIKNRTIFPKYINVQSANMTNYELSINFTVNEPGMRYNLSFSVLTANEQFCNHTILPTATKGAVKVANFTETVYHSHIEILVTPWVSASDYLECPVSGRRQYIYLTFNRNSATGDGASRISHD